MLTRRATAEIVPGHENLCIAILRLVQHKVRNLLAFLGVTHFIKQVFAKPRPLNGFEELLWNNHVRVDIQDRQGGGNAIYFFKLFHHCSP